MKKNRVGYQGIYNKRIKRILDLILAICFFVLLWPVYLIISICIIIDSGFPVFYKAERGGYKSVPFKICKFRSMVVNADKIGGGTTALNDKRITRSGVILRKTKLDEIPQLWNIIRGEMSFVGPRPELLKYTEKYTGNEMVIQEVRPGITDYSSIRFINLDELVGADHADDVYEKKILKKKNELRIKYAEEVSFTTDCHLLFETMVKVVKKSLYVLMADN